MFTRHADGKVLRLSLSPTLYVDVIVIIFLLLLLWRMLTALCIPQKPTTPNKLTGYVLADTAKNINTIVVLIFDHMSGSTVVWLLF